MGGAGPTSGADDELLTGTQLEQAWSNRETLAGPLLAWHEGAGARRKLNAVLACALLAAGLGTWQLLRWAERMHQLPYNMSGIDLARAPTVLTWSDGYGRLGLWRESIARIDLPDRSLELADGHNYAQVEVWIDNGVTTRIKVLTGKVAEIPRHL